MDMDYISIPDIRAQSGQKISGLVALFAGELLLRHARDGETPIAKPAR